MLSRKGDHTEFDVTVVHPDSANIICIDGDAIHRVHCSDDDPRVLEIHTMGGDIWELREDGEDVSYISLSLKGHWF